jgi:hypothetical protein
MIGSVGTEGGAFARPPVRRAGCAELGDGATATWTLSEGTKGRRWREVVVRDGAIVHSLLLETFPDGRFAHLELSTPAGLLTLHPEGDGTLHGNAVTAGGVRHVVGLPWPTGSVVLVEGSVVARAAATLGAAGSGSVPTVVIRRDLTLAPGALDRRSIEEAVDVEALPRLDHGASWPLELE